MRISLKFWKEYKLKRKARKEQAMLAKTSWHSWRAWHPILINDEIMIFEVIERVYDPYAQKWHYKHLMDFLKDGH